MQILCINCVEVDIFNADFHNIILERADKLNLDYTKLNDPTMLVTAHKQCCSRCQQKNTFSIEKLELAISKKKVAILNLEKKINDLHSIYCSDSNANQLMIQIREVNDLSKAILCNLNLIFKSYYNKTVFEFLELEKFRYYSDNASYFSISNLEKLVNLYSIFYEVEFSFNMKQNNLNNLYKKLKKNTDFKETEFFRYLSVLKSNGYLKLIDENRKYFSHDLSYKVNRHFSDCLIIAEYSIEFVELFIVGITELLNDYSQLYANYEMKLVEYSIKEYDLTCTNEDKYVDFNKIKDIHESCNKYVKYLNNQNPFIYSNTYRIEYFEVYDVFSRLSETTRAVLIKLGILFKNPDCFDYEKNFEKVFEAYLTINLSIYRVVAVLDKLAKLICKINFVDIPTQKLYFSGLICLISNKGESEDQSRIFQMISEVIANESYTIIQSHRDRFFHIRDDFCGGPGDMFYGLLFLTYHLGEVTHKVMELVSIIIPEYRSDNETNNYLK